MYLVLIYSFNILKINLKSSLQTTQVLKTSTLYKTNLRTK